VSSYFFNSQIVTAADGTIVLIAPEECRQIAAVHDTIQQLLFDPYCPISRVLFLDLRESMKNGGGPACLRNRVVLTEEESAAVPRRVFLDEQSFADLGNWAEQHYRESLVLSDFLDPLFRNEVATALDELTRILGLGSIYAFQ